MDADKALFAALYAAYQADTGSGGLNASGDQKITDMLRYGSPKRTQAWPYVMVEMQLTETSPFGSNKIPLNQGTVVFHIYSNRDTGLDIQDAVKFRMRALYNRNALTTQTSGGNSWYFAPMELLSGEQQVPDGKVNHYVMPFSITMSGVLA